MPDFKNWEETEKVYKKPFDNDKSPACEAANQKLALVGPARNIGGPLNVIGPK